ncbi:MAG: cytochrome b5 domain-containing protein [Patescibacteria group bacterium]|jgi:hypothetical protein
MIKKIVLVNLILVALVMAFIVGSSTKPASSVIEPTAVSKTETTASTVPDAVIKKADTVPAKSVQTVAATTPPIKVVPDNRCIITVDGSRYDVTEYRDKHSGGDIFTCGTDMTSVFNDQHDSGTLKKMVPYLLK